MLDTILPMLFVKRAAATTNANPRSDNQPQAHMELSRRPDGGSESSVVKSRPTQKRSGAIRLSKKF